jgi:hypothetical protein
LATSATTSEKSQYPRTHFENPECSVPKIESKERPSGKTFLARFREDVIIESRRNSSNFSRNNLLNSLFSLLSAHLSKAGSYLKLGVQNMFERSTLTLG